MFVRCLSYTVLPSTVEHCQRTVPGNLQIRFYLVEIESTQLYNQRHIES